MKALLRTLKGHKDEIERINKEIKKEVRRFHEDNELLYMKEVDGEMIEKVKRVDGTLILKWKNNKSKKRKEDDNEYGPYWYRIVYLPYRKQETIDRKGRKGRYRDIYIGSRLKKEELQKYVGSSEGIDKFKNGRDIRNWPGYMVYDNKIAALRKEKKRFTKETNRIKNTITANNKAKAAALMDDDGYEIY